MSEYTSLEVSRRLQEIGFAADADDLYANVGIPAYRSDTLLEWLLEKGWDVQVGKSNHKVFVDASSRNAGLEVDASNIPDALADVVFAILAPPPKGVEVKSC